MIRRPDHRRPQRRRTRAQYVGLHLGAVVIAPDGVEDVAHVVVAVITVNQDNADARGIGIYLGLDLCLHEGGIQRVRHVSTVAVAWRVADLDIGAGGGEQAWPTAP